MVNQELLDNTAINLYNFLENNTDKKLNKLEFDKTIICTIEGTDEAKKGWYQVTDGVTHFSAYSDNTSYKKDTQVYVKVPNGDMANRKFITDIYTGENDGYIYHISPLNAFIDISGNLVPEEATYSIIANGPKKQITIWEYFPNYQEEERNRLTTLIANTRIDYENKKKEIESDEFEDNKEEKITSLTQNYQYSIDYYQKELDEIASKTFKNFQRLGLRGEFKTNFNRNISYGTYGIVLEVTEKTQASITRIHRYYIDSLDMYGNPYDFGIYLAQESLFDISGIYEIIGMRLCLYQDNNFALDTGEKITNEDNIIYVQNPYISLGYASENFIEDTVLLGTYDSVTYSTQDNNINRTIFLRWIHKQGERFYSIDQAKEIPEEAKIHWYRYRLEHNRNDELAGYFWQEFDPGIDIFNYSFVPEHGRSEDNFKVIIEHPSREYITKQLELNEEIKDYLTIFETQVAEEVNQMCYITDLELLSNTYNTIRAKLTQEQITNLNEIYDIILDDRAKTNYYFSEEFKFINTIDQNDETVDLIRSLSIEVDKEGYQGVYHIYDTTNNIINDYEAIKMRNLKASYASMATAEESLNSAEEITWYFPIKDTMIVYPVSGKEYSGEDEFIENSEQENYCAIKRRGIELTDTDITGLNLIEINQKFRIKDYYDQNAVNNTIYCKIKKRGKIYTATADLTFGPAGVLKNAQTLRLKLCNEQGERISAMTLGEKAIVIPELLDANNKSIAIKKDNIKYSWFSQGNGGITEVIESGNEDENINFSLTIADGTRMEDCANYILQAEVEVREDSLNLDGKNDMPVLNAYLPIAVRKKLEYEIQGPTQIIYNANGTSASYYNKPFKMIEPDKEMVVYWKGNPEADEYPTIFKSGSFKVPAFYINGVNGFSVYAGLDKNVENDIIYIQPILIIQAPETVASILKDWNGHLTLDGNNDIILSAMVGAGIKNSNNEFSGLLMGDIQRGGGEKGGIGLYGYQGNKNTFGFLVDGTAYIGNGTTKISFNGSVGKITGNALEGNKITGGSIYVPNETDPKFSVKSDGTMTCKDATVSGNVTITEGYIKIGSDFEVTNSGHMTCAGATINGPLITSGGTLGGNFSGNNGGTYYFSGGSYTTGDNKNSTYFDVNSDGKLTCKGIEVTGGTIEITMKGTNEENKEVSFSVTKNGYLKCKSALMEDLTIMDGTITIVDKKDSNKIRFSASPDGVIINDGTINIVKKDANGNIEHQFEASPNGITIINGSIKIGKETDKKYFKASSDGINIKGGDIEIIGGSISIGKGTNEKPMFEVNSNGDLYCQNAEIYGVLKAGAYKTLDPQNDDSGETANATYIDDKGILRCRNANIKKATITSGTITNATISSATITSGTISSATISSATIDNCKVTNGLKFGNYTCTLKAKTLDSIKLSNNGTKFYGFTYDGVQAIATAIADVVEADIIGVTLGETKLEFVTY